jgi:twitching motility two-component system response regulator PilH
MTVLVVDDDPVSSQIIEMTLGRRKHQVALVGTAFDAIEKLKGEAGFTLVITELDLPGRMTGLQFVEFLPTDPRWRNLPIIVCTNLADEKTVTEAIRAGVRHYLLKPVKPAVLVEKVEEILARAVPVLEPRFDAMARLEVSEAEYRLLAESTMRYLDRLMESLKEARDKDQVIDAIAIAQRVREPAALLGAGRVVDSVETLNEANNKTQRDQALGLVGQEVSILLDALAQIARPGMAQKRSGTAPSGGAATSAEPVPSPEAAPGAGPAPAVATAPAPEAGSNEAAPAGAAGPASEPAPAAEATPG